MRASQLAKLGVLVLVGLGAGFASVEAYSASASDAHSVDGGAEACIPLPPPSILYSLYCGSENTAQSVE